MTVYAGTGSDVVVHPEGSAKPDCRWWWYDDDGHARNCVGLTYELRIGSSAPSALALVTKTAGIAGRTPVDDTEHSVTVVWAAGELNALVPGVTYSMALIEAPGTSAERTAQGLIRVSPRPGLPA